MKVAVRQALKNGAWYKTTVTKGTKRKEKPSLFQQTVVFSGKNLPGVEKSAFGQLFELKEKGSSNTFKYVLKVIKIDHDQDLAMFANEVRTGYHKSVTEWGTRIYSHTIYEPATKTTRSIQTTQKSGISKRYPLLGMYIMQHVMKGAKPSRTRRFASLRKYTTLRFKNQDQVRKQLMQKLRGTLRAFYKVPKMHGDLHHNNLMVVYDVVKNIATLRKVTIIDYGSTYHFNGAFRKRFSKTHTLKQTFDTQRRIITKNPKIFKRTGNWPRGTSINTYSIPGGGQEIRLNHDVFGYYFKKLLPDVLAHNTNPSKRKPHKHSPGNDVFAAYPINTANISKMASAAPTRPKVSRSPQKNGRVHTKAPPRTKVKKCSGEKGRCKCKCKKCAECRM